MLQLLYFHLKVACLILPMRVYGTEFMMLGPPGPRRTYET